MKLIDKVRNLLKIDRAISMPNIYSLVYSALEQGEQGEGSYMGLVDVYLDGATMFAVISKDGLLYKADVTVTDAGVTLGALVQVVVDYKPAVQSLKTTRQANGKYRWFAFPAATAVLNRSGELDSRQLFESFVKRIEDGAPYPYLSFYHVGEAIKLGQADYVAVDGYTLLISGLWDDEPLAQATRKAIENSPDYYGISIGYMYQPETKQKLQVGEGITIPVYTDGVLVECSILAEKDAACLMTGAYTEGANRMNAKTKAELKKIAADDPALQAQVEELEQHVDSVNQSTEGLIRREGTEAATPEPVVTEEVAAEETPVTEEEPAAPEELELTEEAMQALAERVAGKITEQLSEQLRAVETNAAQALAALTEQFTAMAERISALEAPLAETVKQTIADMPRKKTAVGYRPTQRTAAQPEAEAKITTEDVAQATLANLKQ
jgi:hypothetical protein